MHVQPSPPPRPPSRPEPRPVHRRPRGNEFQGPPHLDELWNAAVEEGLEAIGASLESGEGDPCDLFATEYRDAPEAGDVACRECGQDPDECTCEENA